MAAFWYASVFAMTYDNRIFPLYPHIYSRTLEKPSVFSTDLFYMVASHGIYDEDDVGIPEIFGTYDLDKLAQAVQLLGQPNPFIGTNFDIYTGREMPYNLRGKIETQGLAFFIGPAAFNEYISFGASFFFMHAFSRIHFQLAKNSLALSFERELELDRLRSAVQDSVGLQAPIWNKVGFSDIDAYMRVGKVWEYCYKLKRLDVGARFGIMIPTGLTRMIDNPASVPFGGNGHFGVYGAIDCEVELKEDWKVGLLVRGNKRITKTMHERVPIAGEHPLFGAFAGPLKVNPGATGIFVPYASMEDIRDGLGLQGQYTVVVHGDDAISDPRAQDRTPELQLKKINAVSDWVSEYLTFVLFYDFAKVKKDNWYAPIVTLMWDMPVNFFLAERVSKTNRVSLGVLVSF